MAREDPQLKLRINEELKNQIVEAAKKNNRSVNAEIAWRLEMSFGDMAQDLRNTQLFLKQFMDSVSRGSFKYVTVEEFNAKISKLKRKDEVEE